MRLNDDQRQKLENQYLSGLSVAVLAQDYDVNGETVRAVLRKAGVRLRGRWALDQEKASFIKEYKEGASSAEIAKRYGFTDAAVLIHIRAGGVEIRDAASARRIYPLNERAFAVLSDEMAYWTGFLMADGCVSDCGRISIGLKPSDHEHLEKLKLFIESPDRPVKHYKLCCFLQIDSSPMAADLRQWGVVPRKSLVATARGGVEHYPSFWRGVIDGDGSHFMTKIGYPSMKLCGSAPLMEQYRTFLRDRVFRGLYDPAVTRRAIDTLKFVSLSGGFSPRRR